ncbi:MAG TPA: hypothetical protein VLS93_14640 [Anaeromyxobacteraceae bacterium]|nr:hypothetical protein [Anaeromyxobacteraceae bacterium]
MARSAVYYQGVRGSAALATRALAPLAPEELEPGELRRVPFAGELLGAVRVRGSYAALPLEAFDRACEALEAEEQAAYLQLLRLAWGEGRNFCRAGKRELMARLRLSERRLLRVLDALVARGFARPLHRDNRGTLWRVFLPREAFGERMGDDVLLGRAGPAPVRGGAHPRPEPERGARDPAAPGALALARALARARGAEGTAGQAEAAREVRELLDEGQTPARIAASIEALRRRGTARLARAEGAP